MPEKYSSKKQEQFFQPRRIQLVASYRIRSRYARRVGNPEYAVEIRNILDRNEQPVVWCKATKMIPIQGTGGQTYKTRKTEFEGWSDELPDDVRMKPPGTHEGHKQRKGEEAQGIFHAEPMDGLTKGEALEIAKREAVRRELPFSIKGDIVRRRELERGPQQNCVTCGKEKVKRSFEPVVCEDCQKALSVGRTSLTDAAKHAYFIAEDIELLKHESHGRHGSVIDETKMFRGLMTRLVSGEVDNNTTRVLYNPPGLVISRKQLGKDKVSCYGVRLSHEQAGAMQNLVSYIHEAVTKAYDAGLKRGNSIIHGLASGEFSVEQFNELAIGK